MRLASSDPSAERRAKRGERLIEKDSARIQPPAAGPDAPNVDGRKPPTSWQQRLRETYAEFLSTSSACGRARGELWLVLNVAIRRFVRGHVQHLGEIPFADIEDIASEKSLDLLGQIEALAWDIKDRTDAEIGGFVSRVARNGAVDYLRRRQRHREIEVDLEREKDAASSGLRSGIESPDTSHERRKFVEALRECVAQLESRALRIWFFRVFYGLSTREIALHPDVAGHAKGVDMLLSRTRKKIGECMERKGHRAEDLPAGTFVEIWNLLQGGQEERTNDSSTEILG